jgi:hypothetical protein
MSAVKILPQLNDAHGWLFVCGKECRILAPSLQQERNSLKASGKNPTEVSDLDRFAQPDNSIASARLFTVRGWSSEGPRVGARRARTGLNRPKAVARTTKVTKLQDLFLCYDVTARGQ